MVRKVIWTKNASNEWKSILEFWINKTGTNKYSRKLNNKIRIVINYIRINNKIGTKTNLKNIRLMLCSHYKIFYKIDKDTIYIVSIFDSRRNPEKSTF